MVDFQYDGRLFKIEIRDEYELVLQSIIRVSDRLFFRNEGSDIFVRLNCVIVHKCFLNSLI